MLLQPAKIINTAAIQHESLGIIIDRMRVKMQNVNVITIDTVQVMLPVIVRQLLLSGSGAETTQQEEASQSE